MATRIISAVVAIPLLVFFIIVGGLPLRCAVLLLSLIGMYELYKAVSGKIKIVHIAGFALEIIYMVTAEIYKLNIFTDIPFGLIVAVFTLAILAIMIMLVVNHKTNNIHDASVTIFGFFYVGVLLSMICFIRENSLKLSWLPFIIAFGSDTGAYFVGSKLGKHKLAPILSPKKSIEGAVGGVLTVAVLSGIYGYFITDIVGIMPLLLLVIGSSVGAVLSQYGDLAASSIKRYTGIKDYGKLMPGHGGVLDRFDSVLFTLPLVYALCILISI